MNGSLKDTMLPLGSVLRLKGAKQNVVVIGYAVVEEGDVKVWDYLGCPYPTGVISSDQNLLFNIEEIDRVIFFGYSAEEDKKYRSALVQNLKKIKENNVLPK
ncbi:MAG: DUF4176 domain-containing protein [Bacilli bacterium]|nr:DUF4176 domain-containing protein [Bacilli bacterium]